MELGGKSPCLVFESADLEQGEYQSIHLSIPFQALFVSTLACDFMLIDILVFSHLGLTGYSLAANWAALGICYNTGQDCTAGSRVYVQESIYDKFIELLTATVKSTVVGDGFDEQTTCGPVVR